MHAVDLLCGSDPGQNNKITRIYESLSFIFFDHQHQLFACGGWKILDIKCAKKASHFDDRTKKFELRYRNEWKNRIFGATLIICNGLKEQLSCTELVAGM